MILFGIHKPHIRLPAILAVHTLLLVLCDAWTAWNPAYTALPPAPQQATVASANVAVATTTRDGLTYVEPTSPLIREGVSTWIADAPSPPPPSKDDVQLLRNAFAVFYGVDRNLEQSETLLSQTIERWQGQPPDEIAGLYRVRGDCHMLLGKAEAAIADYDQAIQLLDGPGGNKADPAELPAALLGRARSLKSLGATNRKALSKQQASKAASDYRRALTLLSREEWDSEQELIEDGVSRNPFAAWEWGAVLRSAEEWDQAAKAHKMAADSFDDIGDKARSVISLLDAGIDLAAADKIDEAKSVLENAIGKTKGVEGRDVLLLQRVIAKEGEGRMALASLLWANGQRGEAEGILGDACIRMEQLQMDAAQWGGKGATPATDAPQTPLKFSIDDDVPPLSLSCFKFRDPTFVTEQLGWPENLQNKVSKLQTLK